MVDSAEAASYYDTLSTGQIATTFAEILAIRGGAADTGAVLDAVGYFIKPVNPKKLSEAVREHCQTAA